YTSNVYLMRNLMLRQDAGAKPNAGDIKPFPNVAYDWLMWIDSDMVWNPEDVHRLIAHDRDIVTGLAITDPPSMRLNIGEFNAEGGTRFWHCRELSKLPRDDNGLIECGFAGYGFLLVKRGVFEAMSFPWFYPERVRIGNVDHYLGEDISWSKKARECGFKIWADPVVQVGHEKSAVVRVKASETVKVEV
ncbi:MAG: hypothetical protein MUF84_11600, partial [Anaerolineae bacterium]|nr:hypothetical protein [Anaerolineae bacterium]